MANGPCAWRMDAPRLLSFSPRSRACRKIFSQHRINETGSPNLRSAPVWCRRGDWIGACYSPGIGMRDRTYSPENGYRPLTASHRKKRTRSHDILPHLFPITINPDIAVTLKGAIMIITAESLDLLYKKTRQPNSAIKAFATTADAMLK
jgi:hypothetical protein